MIFYVFMVIELIYTFFYSLNLLTFSKNLYFCQKIRKQ